MRLFRGRYPGSPAGEGLQDFRFVNKIVLILVIVIVSESYFSFRFRLFDDKFRIFVVVVIMTENILFLSTIFFYFRRRLIWHTGLSKYN